MFENFGRSLGLPSHQTYHTRSYLHADIFLRRNGCRGNLHYQWGMPALHGSSETLTYSGKQELLHLFAIEFVVLLIPQPVAQYPQFIPVPASLCSVSVSVNLAAMQLCLPFPNLDVGHGTSVGMEITGVACRVFLRGVGSILLKKRAVCTGWRADKSDVCRRRFGRRPACHCVSRFSYRVLRASLTSSSSP